MARPLFLHSLFRTGSTYLWNKFRQCAPCRCYYEPFHQVLSTLATDQASPFSGDPETTRRMGHPDLSRDYLDEYRHLLREGEPGVPHFRKAFSFDDYCRRDDHPEQKRYIDFLIEGAGGRIPVFKFCRSPLRSRWFKSNFPQALHVYLVRRPESQFMSYLSMMREKEMNIFLVMDLLAAGVNRGVEPFCRLAGRLPLIEYHSTRFDDEAFFYGQALDLYDLEEKYLIFYFLWFAALMENLLHADLIISLDRLSADPAYRNEVTRTLQTAVPVPLDFSDAAIRERPLEGLDRARIEERQDEAQFLVLGGYAAPERERVAGRLANAGLDLGSLDASRWPKLAGRRSAPADRDRDRIRRLEALLQKLADTSSSLSRQQAELEKQSRRRIRKLEEESQQQRQVIAAWKEDESRMQSGWNRRSYRLGRFLLAPFRLLSEWRKRRRRRT